MKKIVPFLLILVLLSGCICPNYKTYVESMEADLQELRPMVEDYVYGDERLSEADHKARLAVLDEMEDKTKVAKKDVE
jgi:hypothetical protein